MKNSAYFGQILAGQTHDSEKETAVFEASFGARGGNEEAYSLVR